MTAEQLPLFSTGEPLAIPPGWRLVRSEVLQGELSYLVEGKVRRDPRGPARLTRLWKTAAGLRALGETLKEPGR